MKIHFLAHALPEESPRSVLIRTAYANGFISVSAMARSINSKESILPFLWQTRDSKMNQYLGGIKELNGDQFLNSLYMRTSKITKSSPIIFMGINLAIKQIRTDAYVFCPECVSEGVHRLAQDLIWTESCPYHLIKYYHECPNCHAPIRWTQLRGPYCRCGFDLQTSPRVMSKAIGSQIIMNFFRSNDQASLNRFIFSLKALRYSKDQPECISIVDLAAQIANCDEESFAETIKASKEKHSCLPMKAHLAPWAESGDIWIESQVQKELAGQTKIFQEQDKCNCATFNLSHKEICYALSLSPGKIQTFIRHNIIKKEYVSGLPKQYHSTRLCKLIKNPDHLHLKSPGKEYKLSLMEKGFITISETTKTLCTYPEAINKAISAGLLKDGLIIGKNRQRFIKESEIKIFQEKYILAGNLAREISAPARSISAKLIKLGITPQNQEPPYIYSRSEISKETIDKILSADYFKTIPPRKYSRTITDNQIQNLSSSDAAKELGIAVILLKNLQELGLLEETNTPTKTRHFTRKSVKKARNWLNRMTTPSELAEKLGIPNSTFHRRFVKSGFIKTIILGKRILTPKKEEKHIKINIEKFISCAEADKELDAPSGHTANMIKTGRLHPAKKSETGNITTVRLLHRSEIHKLKNLTNL